MTSHVHGVRKPREGESGWQPDFSTHIRLIILLCNVSPVITSSSLEPSLASFMVRTPGFLEKRCFRWPLQISCYFLAPVNICRLHQGHHLISLSSLEGKARLAMAGKVGHPWHAEPCSVPPAIPFITLILQGVAKHVDVADLWHSCIWSPSLVMHCAKISCQAAAL